MRPGAGAAAEGYVLGGMLAFMRKTLSGSYLSSSCYRGRGGRRAQATAAASGWTPARAVCSRRVRWLSLAPIPAARPRSWRPAIRPKGGVMVDDTIYFGGGPNTRWSRNLAANRFVAVHLESASQVVVAEGRVDRISDPDDPRLRAADDAYEVKYKMRHGPPMWVLNPEVVIAWSNFPKDATRFRLWGTKNRITPLSWRIATTRPEVQPSGRRVDDRLWVAAG
jgi:hypothetical protein